MQNAGEIVSLNPQFTIVLPINVIGDKLRTLFFFVCFTCLSYRELINNNNNNNNNLISIALLCYVQGALQSFKQHY